MTDEELHNEIVRFNHERDNMLMLRDPKRLISFMRSRKLKVPSSYAVAEMMLHKYTTASHGVSMSLRTESKQWLWKNGYTAWDDGDVPV
jgi:hypothetical protein